MQILLQSKQKRCTNTEIAAAAKDKADRAADAASKAQQDRSELVTRLAQLEDAIEKEDRSYKYKYNVSAGKDTTSKARYCEVDVPIANLR